MLRSIISVFLGWLTWGILSNIGAAIVPSIFPSQFHEDGSVDSAFVLSLFLALSFLYSLASGYVTAWVAKGKIMNHVIALAIFNLLFGIMVETMYWNQMPVWYHVLFLLCLVPFILIGGKMRIFLHK